MVTLSSLVSSVYGTVVPKTGTRHNKTWPERRTLQLCEENSNHQPLVPRDKIMFPLLHIKLGLMNRYVKVSDKDENCFSYLCSAFPGHSEEKLKARIFNDPKIWKTIRDKDLMASMTTIEKKYFSLKRDVPDLNHSRKSRKRKFLPFWFNFIWLQGLYLFDNAFLLFNLIILCLFFSKEKETRIKCPVDFLSLSFLTHRTLHCDSEDIFWGKWLPLRTHTCH